MTIQCGKSILPPQWYSEAIKGFHVSKRFYVKLFKSLYLLRFLPLPGSQTTHTGKQLNSTPTSGSALCSFYVGNQDNSPRIYQTISVNVRLISTKREKQGYPNQGYILYCECLMESHEQDQQAHGISSSYNMHHFLLSKCCALVFFSLLYIGMYTRTTSIPEN